MILFLSGFLTAIGLCFVATGLILWLGSRSAVGPSREETEQLAARVRAALERQAVRGAALSIYKATPEWPSTLVSRN